MIHVILGSWMQQMLVVFAMIDNLFDTVKSDIDHMISAMQ